MRIQAVYCALACAAALGAHEARANSQSGCPPSCNQHAPAPHVAQPPHATAPPAHFFMNPRGFTSTPPPIGAPPPAYAQAGYPAAPTAQSGAAPSTPSSQHPPFSAEFAVRPGFTGTQPSGSAPPSGYAPVGSPVAPAARSGTPQFAIQPGFAGTQPSVSAPSPIYAQAGYPTALPVAQSGAAQSTPSAQNPPYNAQFATPPGFTGAQPSGGAPSPGYAPISLPTAPWVAPPAQPVPQNPPSSAQTFAPPSSVALSQASPPVSTQPQGSSPLVYACRTPLGICPVAFSGPAEAGSACLCVDPSTGRQDNGAIQ